MDVIYSGRFRSRTGALIEVRLLREAAVSAGELTFPWEEPLVIEWPERGKEEVLCGSTATLKLLSPGDRTYLGLYTGGEGSEVRLDVLKDGQLYWRGVLDTELYEEPYSTLEGYEVSLTFSDLGRLERQKWTLRGMQTLREIVAGALRLSQLGEPEIDESLISTCLLAGGSRLSLSDLTVLSDNFYDEDGEAMTLAGVVTGVLQPLGLRLVQSGGRVWVYDLNGLYTSGPLKAVRWMSDDQVLALDRIYNNVKVTWSPYVCVGDQSPKECWTEATDANETALNTAAGSVSGNCRLWTYHHSLDLAKWPDDTDAGFTLWTSEEGKNAELVDGSVRFFKIVPQADGEAKEGVAVWWRGVEGYRQSQPLSTRVELLWSTQGPGWTPGGLGSLAGGVLWKSAETWLPPMASGEGLRLRIAMEMLMDCRVNPFEAAAKLMVGTDQRDWERRWQKRGNYVYVPVTLKWQADGSDDVWVWTDRTVLAKPLSQPVTSLGGTYGEWVSYAGENDGNPSKYGHLCWYDAEDREESCGVLGWKKNRAVINPHRKALTSGLRLRGEGQCVRYPTMGGRGGRLWLEVRKSGWMVVDGGDALSSGAQADSYGLWSGDRTWWCLMGLPSVTVEREEGYDGSIDGSDVEYNCELSAQAKESLEIETVCGSVEAGSPLARGIYRRSDTLAEVKELTRGTRTGQVEDLLAGTLYSQYAERKIRLSGTTEAMGDGLKLWSEAMQGGRRFLLSGAAEDVRGGVSESVLVELRPDEWSAVNG